MRLSLHTLQGRIFPMLILQGFQFPRHLESGLSGLSGLTRNVLGSHRHEKERVTFDVSLPSRRLSPEHIRLDGVRVSAGRSWNQKP
jgi:hypothetical protein